MKRILSFIISLILIMGLVGCNKKEEVSSVKIVLPAGSPTLGMVKMINEKSDNMDFEIVKTTDLLMSKLLSGEADISVIPTNLAAKLYNKGIDYKIAGPSVWGSLYIVSTEDLASIEDLKGKEMYTIGKGLTPDILLQYVLKENGIDPSSDLEINYLSGATELAPMFISGKSSISMMPEPMLSKVMNAKKDAKIVLDLQKEWMKITGSDKSYPQACLVVRGDFAKENPDYTSLFIETYSESIKWVNQNKEEAGKYYEELELGLDAKTIAASIERSNLEFVDSEDAKEDMEKYLKVLFDYSKESIGGKLPDDKIYY